ncbi:MAG: hypothetical protein HUU02_14445 [Bacteroidetes bacterium]|nr:hypothetical protein [Bacteroidota bacterium]
MVHRLTAVFILLMVSAALANGGERFTLRVNDLLLTLSAEARIISVVREGEGQDLRSDPAPGPFLILRTPHNRYYADRCQLRHDSLLVLRCSPLNAEFTLLFRRLEFGTYVEVLSAGCDSVLQMDLFNLSLDLSRSDTAAFGVCLLPLTLHARSAQSPVLQDAVKGSVYRRFGMTGASWFLTAGPLPLLRRSIANALTSFPQMPYSPYGGPFADTSSYARGSYVMSYGSLTMSTIGQWTTFMKGTGFDQVQFHGGTERSFRFGDLEPDRRYWPSGWLSYRPVTEGLRRRGVASTLHTYSFLIDRSSTFVTPIPDPDLAVSDTVFFHRECHRGDTLIAIRTRGRTDLSEGDLLRSGEEIMTIKQVHSTGTECLLSVERGTSGTSVQEHRASAPLHVLLSAYGFLLPSPGSPLFRTIARRHAIALNEGGFDGLYLDGIDAADRFGDDGGWYWSALFITEVWKHLKRPVPMDMGAMTAHTWRFRTRWEAWDFPTRGRRQAVEAHVRHNSSGILLPHHLGWWSWSSTATEPWEEEETPGEFAHLLQRAKQTRAGISFAGEPPFSRLLSGDLRWKFDLLQRNWMGSASLPSDDRSPMTAEPSAQHTVRAGRGYGTRALSGSSGRDAAPFDRTAVIRSTFSSSNGPLHGTPEPVFFPLRIDKPKDEEWRSISLTFDPPIDLSAGPLTVFQTVADVTTGVLAVRMETGDKGMQVILDRFIPIERTGSHAVRIDGMNYDDAGSIRWPMMTEAPWRYFRGKADLRNVRSLSFILGGDGPISTTIDSLRYR